MCTGPTTKSPAKRPAPKGSLLVSKEVSVERARLAREFESGNPARVAAAAAALRQLDAATAGSGVTPPPEPGATLGLRLSPPKVGAGDLRLPLIGGIK